MGSRPIAVPFYGQSDRGAMEAERVHGQASNARLD